MNILVINSGSSSLKYQLFRMPHQQPLAGGVIERIGDTNAGPKDHEIALRQIISSLTQGNEPALNNVDEITAVGHRVVHGGELFSSAVKVNADVKKQIKKLFSLAPLHNPANYACIEIAEKAFKKAEQIAVFDTAFHQTIPEKTFRYALPDIYYKKSGIRVYGFHGTSHKYVAEQATKWLDKPDSKLISIHLGNGCSMAAIKSGDCIDTSMGFGPLSGLMMGTRSGDIDPSILLHLIEQDGFDSEKLNDLLNKRSGLLGVGGSSDMRDIRHLIKTGNQNAALAVDMYAYRIKKFIGAYTAALNGLDAIIFTAGVGENDIHMRQEVCENMNYLGIEIDEHRNKRYKKEIIDVSKAGSDVRILVIPTNEEYEIASQCFNMLNG